MPPVNHLQNPRERMAFPGRIPKSLFTIFVMGAWVEGVIKVCICGESARAIRKEDGEEKAISKRCEPGAV
jgi:hypothetical protein